MDSRFLMFFWIHKNWLFHCTSINWMFDIAFTDCHLQKEWKGPLNSNSTFVLTDRRKNILIFEFILLGERLARWLQYNMIRLNYKREWAGFNSPGQQGLCYFHVMTKLHSMRKLHTHTHTHTRHNLLPAEMDPQWFKGRTSKKLHWRKWKSAQTRNWPKEGWDSEKQPCKAQLGITQQFQSGLNPQKSVPHNTSLTIKCWILGRARQQHEN